LGPEVPISKEEAREKKEKKLKLTVLFSYSLDRREQRRRDCLETRKGKAKQPLVKKKSRGKKGGEGEKPWDSRK